MKKSLYFISALVFFSFSTAGVIATYNGDLEKQGPEAEFLVGYASDKKSELKIEVPEKQNLNISYLQNYTFDPEKEQRYFERQGESLALKEFKIKVKSRNPDKELYEIPVSITELPSSASGQGIDSKTALERQYTFKYYTSFSNEFEGDLISSKNNETKNSSNKNKSDSENSLRPKNNSIKYEGPNQEKSRSLTTLVLGIAVFLVFGYIFYEVAT